MEIFFLNLDEFNRFDGNVCTQPLDTYPYLRVNVIANSENFIQNDLLPLLCDSFAPAKAIFDFWKFGNFINNLTLLEPDPETEERGEYICVGFV